MLALPATAYSLSPASIELPVVSLNTLIPVPEPNQVDTVLYHRNCMDGMTAAWAAWRVLGDGATYIPVTYNDPVPDVTGKNVAVVDFHFPRPVVEQMLASAASFILMDHHKTAQEWLKGVPNTVVDLGRAGARLSWGFFHPGVAAPDLVRYAEDYDLWKFELPYSHEYNASVELQSPSIGDYEALSQADPGVIVANGAVILKYIDKIANTHAAKAVERGFHGYRVLVVNGTTLINETAEILRQRPDCDFAVVWYFDHSRGKIKVSLRSKKGGTDVSALALKYPGGGGHAAAAGFLWEGTNIEDLFDAPKSEHRG